MEVLAKRLKWLREKERYSQKDIADKIGMSPSGYQKIERDERDPKLDVLVKLCEVFNISSDFLLGKTNETKLSKKLGLRVDIIRIEIEQLQREHNELFINETVLEEEIKRLERVQAGNRIKLDRSGIESLMVKKEQLQMNQNRRESIKQRVHDLTRNRGDVLFKYILAILEIPFSKPSEDSVLKQYLPIHFEIQYNIFEKFAVSMYAKDVGFIGDYNEFDTPEEAEEEINRLHDLLNN